MEARDETAAVKSVIAMLVPLSSTVGFCPVPVIHILEEHCMN